jgi:phosphatidylethanolamine-binding protein (PEBP) family uncharacterized protein
MAQRTGAYGLVALVALAFAVTGCGGGSSSSAIGATDAARPATTTEETTTAATKPEGQKQPQAEQKKQKNQNSAQAQEGKEAKPGKKHGAHISLPEGPPEPPPSKKLEEESSLANMSVSSSAIDSSGSISRTYTCDGKSESPPIEWLGVPAGTEELAVFVSNIAPVEGKIFFDWAVAGIDPEATGIEAGKVPPGAVVGKNSEGKKAYSLCPAGSEGESYVLTLFALEKGRNPKQGFDPGTFREEAQAESESAGLLSFSYTG